MAVASSRFGSLSYSGDVSATVPLDAALNPSSPGLLEPEVALASGDNTIAVPTGTTCVSIKFPAGNNILVKLKGNALDAGISLHKTDPAQIPLDATQTSIILNAGAPVTIQIYFS